MELGYFLQLSVPPVPAKLALHPVSRILHEISIAQIWLPGGGHELHGHTFEISHHKPDRWLETMQHCCWVQVVVEASACFDNR